MNNKFFNDELTYNRSDFDFFINLYMNNKLPQTLLLTGEKGAGKLNFVYHLVNFILSQNEIDKYDTKLFKINSNNKTSNLLLQNIHPNFCLINRKKNKKYIENSQIKEMQTFLNLSSFNNKPKIIVINECEFLNMSSSNSLLKSLEEEYLNVFFILIRDDKKFLIKTIKSRCINFNFILNSKERIKRINEILDNQYEILSNDFKDKYLTPYFFSELSNYCKKNNFDIGKINLDILITNIFLDKNIKKDEFVYNNFYLLMQLFFHKRITSNINNEKNFNLLKYFTKRLDDVFRFNLDLDAYILEFKNLIYNEK